MGDTETIETLARNQADNVTEAVISCTRSEIRDNNQTGTVTEDFVAKEQMRKQKEQMEKRARTKTNQRNRGTSEEPEYDNRLLREEKMLGISATAIAVSIFCVFVFGISALVAWLEGWEF